jgi:hypothetical protein
MPDCLHVDEWGLAENEKCGSLALNISLNCADYKIMGNLIQSFGREGDHKELCAIPVAAEALSAAHQTLRAAAHEVLGLVLDVPLGQRWGSTIKRNRVLLANNPTQRPLLLRTAKVDHNLAEVINQCATIERLIDALNWAQRRYGKYLVERCHPSTGCKKGKPPADNPHFDFRDNDLILVKPNDPNAPWIRFEATDISGVRDTNGKIRDDIYSLGLKSSQFHDDQRFIVVCAPSAEETANAKHWFPTLLGKGKCGCSVAPEKGPSGASVILKVTL